MAATPDEAGRGEITRLLEAHRGGDREALNALFPLIYEEIRRIAHSRRASGSGETLNTTALVHEAYLKLAHSPGGRWQHRGHFFAVASRVMRQVIVDYARRQTARKRGGGAPHVDIAKDEPATMPNAEEVLGVDEALDRLALLSERLAKVVELRFFCGLSVDETAETLGLNPRTVKRDWQKARAFLYRDLQGA